jgi:hypothetical protein
LFFEDFTTVLRSFSDYLESWQSSLPSRSSTGFLGSSGLPRFQLKNKLGVIAVLIPTLPLVDRFGVFRPEPEEILDWRSRKQHNRAVVDVLVCWHDQTVAEASWEPFHRLKADFPHLVGKVF